MNFKTSQLTEATTLTDDDLFMVIDVEDNDTMSGGGGTNKKIKASTIIDYISNNVSIEGLSDFIVPITISNSTNADALRITHTGTSGNALVVEDFTNPDATPFVIDNSGRVIAGLTTALSVPLSTSTLAIPGLQRHGAIQADASLLGVSYNTAAAAAANLILARSRGSLGEQGLVLDGDSLGRVVFEGSDGQSIGANAGFIRGATIDANVDGEPSAGEMPARLTFSTTSDGAAIPTERMRITSAGKVGIGTTAPVSKLHVSDGSPDAALTVTQTGAGDALVVQDVAGDSTPFVIDGTGRVVVGIQTAFTTTNLGTLPNQIHSTWGANIGIYNWASDAGTTAGIRLIKSQGGSIGTNGVLADGADIGVVQFWGDDGADFYRGAQIVAEVDGLIGQFATSLSSGVSYRIKSAGTTDFTTFGAADNNVGTVFTANRDGAPEDGDGVAIKTSGDMPGRLSFWTTEDGNGAPAERMRITRAGRIGVGNTNPQVSLDVTGDITVRGSSTTNKSYLNFGTSYTSGIVGYDATDKILGINNVADGIVRISTNNTEKMRVTSGGNVGINTTDPETRLHVVGDLTMESATTANTATAGTNGDVPAQVVGYLQVKINGTNCKIPYYA